MRYRFIWTILCLFVLMPTGTGLETPRVSAQQEPPAALDGAIVAVYRGDCDDALIGPLYELGTLEHRKVVDFRDSPSTVDEEEPQQADLHRLDEDRDGDGVLDVDEDQNANGTLDTGIDINASETLDDDEIIPESALVIHNIPEVWMLERERASEMSEFWDSGHVIAVHQGSGEDRRIIACGGPGDVPDEGSSFISLAPVGDANYRGYARLVLGEVPEDKDIYVVMFETLLQEDEDQQRQEAATPAS